MTDHLDPAASPWIRLGAYAVASDAAGRLLCSRVAPGYPWAGTWTLPGGGVEWGEHPDEAVLRELGEETGLIGRIGRIIGIHSHIVERPMSRPGPAHVIAILYQIADVTGELRVEQAGSSDACAWLTPAELAELPRVPLIDVALAEITSSDAEITSSNA
ncbi:MAG: NUDIX domain-containing protein [Chloroflexi bacterium]|nr:NUDIX domain-containing protein [Chloroflexota bacterium]